MAISDIPEFIEVVPGDLIKSSAWNEVQRQVRNSIRTHRHTRAGSTAADDTTSVDSALQIGASEIASNAVITAKLANDAVTTDKLKNAAVNFHKLAFVEFTGTAQTNPLTISGSTPVELYITSNLSGTDILFPSIVIDSGSDAVLATIIYRRGTTDEGTNAFLRLTKGGEGTVRVSWKVRKLSTGLEINFVPSTLPVFDVNIG